MTHNFVDDDSDSYSERVLCALANALQYIEERETEKERVSKHLAMSASMGKSVLFLPRAQRVHSESRAQLSAHMIAIDDERPYAPLAQKQ